MLLNDGAPDEPKIVGNGPFLFLRDSRCAPLGHVFVHPREAFFFVQISL